MYGDSWLTCKTLPVVVALHFAQVQLRGRIRGRGSTSASASASHGRPFGGRRTIVCTPQQRWNTTATTSRVGISCLNPAIPAQRSREPGPDLVSRSMVMIYGHRPGQSRFRWLEASTVHLARRASGSDRARLCITRDSADRSPKPSWRWMSMMKTKGHLYLMVERQGSG